MSSAPKHAPTLGYQEATSVYVSGLPLDITKEELGVFYYLLMTMPDMIRNSLWICGQAEESENIRRRGGCSEGRCAHIVYQGRLYLLRDAKGKIISTTRIFYKYSIMGVILEMDMC